MVLHKTAVATGQSTAQSNRRLGNFVDYLVISNCVDLSAITFCFHGITIAFFYSPNRPTAGSACFRVSWLGKKLAGYSVSVNFVSLKNECKDKMMDCWLTRVGYVCVVTLHYMYIT